MARGSSVDLRARDACPARTARTTVNKPHSFPRALCCLFSLGLLASACAPKARRGGPTSPATQSAAQAAAKLNLPPPLPIPPRIPARLFLRSPQSLQAAVRIATEDPQWSISQELREALATSLEAQDAQRIAAICDPGQPWHFVALRGGVEIMSARIQTTRSSALDHWLQSLPKAGDFGARKLKPKRKGGQSWLVWSGPTGEQLLLAPSLRGLVTAMNLRATKSDIQANIIPAGLTNARRQQLGLTSQIQEMRAQGELSNLSVDLKVDDALSSRLRALPLRPGPLPQLLRASDLVWSGSSTWTQAKTEVNRFLGRIRTQVADLPFLVRPTAESLERRLGQSARQLDGRAAVALDQRQTLRLGLGVTSIAKSESATLGLIQATIPNLQLMRSFSTSIPSARLVQQRARSNGIKIHELILSDISGQIPRELHGLLSRRRQLHIAMAWAPDSQALLLCVGPEAVSSMLAWIQSTQNMGPLFASPQTPVLAQARTTVAASMVLNWIDSDQGLPSLSQLLRMRSATPRQDYAMSMTPIDRNEIHLDLRLEQEGSNL